MKISIIIPTYNEAQNIGRLLTHLLTSGSDDLEVIVVDGGSDDETLDICKEFDIKTAETSTSRAKQLNKGAEIALHDVLYFVHADTIPPKTFKADIEKTISDGNPAGTYRSQYEGGNWLMNINAFFTRFYWLVSRGGDQSLFIQKQLFKDLGGFDERMEIMEEYPLIEQLMKQNQLKIMDNSILISTRKYLNRNWFKVSRANYIAFKMFKRGEPSKKIKLKYKELLE